MKKIKFIKYNPIDALYKSGIYYLKIEPFSFNNEKGFFSPQIVANPPCIIAEFYMRLMLKATY